MKLRIGSRGSALAQWQANHIAALLREQGHDVEIEIIKTTGDRLQPRPALRIYPASSRHCSAPSNSSLSPAPHRTEPKWVRRSRWIISSISRKSIIVIIFIDIIN